MIRGPAAGALAGLALLAAGTLLGTLRVLVIAPRVGAGLALVAEIPPMLAFAWWLAGRFGGGLSPVGRAAMAVTTLAVLLAGEAALAGALAGIGPRAWLARLAAPAEWPGLAAQVVAAMMPLLRFRH